MVWRRSWPRFNTLSKKPSSDGRSSRGSPESSVTDEIVRVACVDSAETIKIHESLLTKNAPLLDIHRPQYSASADASLQTLSAFALWLYTGVTPIPNYHGCDYDITHLLDAYVLGRNVGCVDFMDASLDVAIKELYNVADSLWIYDPLNAFSAIFPAGSAGRKFAVDFVTHVGYLSDSLGDYTVYEQVCRVDDKGILLQLAQTISVAQAYQVADELKNLEFCKILITGFFEAAKDENKAGVRPYPWETDICQYHHHRELGLPCYTTKRNSNIDSSGDADSDEERVRRIDQIWHVHASA